jgi:hypothetical protein
MIHKKQRKILKKILGSHYTDKVLHILKEKSVTTRKGTAYGSSMIRNVFNGINENKAIESAILELFTQKLEKSEKMEVLKNELLAMADS